MTQDKFIDLIVKKTGLSAPQVRENVKEDDSYPVSPDFEEGLAKIMENFSRYARLLDSEVERTPMKMGTMMDAAQKAMATAGMSGQDMQVASIFQTALNEIYDGQFDSRLVMPSRCINLGQGMVMIFFNRITGSFEALKNSPDGKLNDFIENRPHLVLFLDTTPGREGFRSFLVDYRDDFITE